MLLLSYLQTDNLKFRRRHLWLSISGYLLTSDYQHSSISVGSLFPSIELKIYYMLYAVHNLYLLLPVLIRHIDHLIYSWISWQQLNNIREWNGKADSRNTTYSHTIETLGERCRVSALSRSAIKAVTYITFKHSYIFIWWCFWNSNSFPSPMLISIPNHS